MGGKATATRTDLNCPLRPSLQIHCVDQVHTTNASYTLQVATTCPGKPTHAVKLALDFARGKRLETAGIITCVRAAFPSLYSALPCATAAADETSTASQRSPRRAQPNRCTRTSGSSGRGHAHESPPRKLPSQLSRPKSPDKAYQARSHFGYRQCATLFDLASRLFCPYLLTRRVTDSVIVRACACASLCHGLSLREERGGWREAVCVGTGLV